MVKITLTSVGSVIDFLGGTQAVADMMDVSQAAVGNWRMQRKFPSATYLAFRTALQKEGAQALDKLWSMRQAAK